MTRIAGILGGATVPEWPDFGIEQLPTDEQRDHNIWRASTDTHRPVTPVFSVIITGARLGEDEARLLLGERLRELYEKAHPDGCPGSH